MFYRGHNVQLSHFLFSFWVFRGLVASLTRVLGWTDALWWASSPPKLAACRARLRSRGAQMLRTKTCHWHVLPRAQRPTEPFSFFILGFSWVGGFAYACPRLDGRALVGIEPTKA